MNICKFMLTEVFKWISEATPKPESFRQFRTAHSGLLYSLMFRSKKLVV